MSERKRDFLPILGRKALNSNIIQHNKMARIKEIKTHNDFLVQEGEVEDMFVEALARYNDYTIVQSIRFIITQWNDPS